MPPASSTRTDSHIICSSEYRQRCLLPRCSARKEPHCSPDPDTYYSRGGGLRPAQTYDTCMKDWHPFVVCGRLIRLDVREREPQDAVHSREETEPTTLQSSRAPGAAVWNNTVVRANQERSGCRYRPAGPEEARGKCARSFGTIQSR